ncbi:carbohydrate porin [Vibrio artabrorum]|uniref:Carbohydrate porin n=1 Tax=Vibrio artabrorum TaxID=446374 RepID=A0ABT8CKD3_9VIBR|nr:carbohydrate porin [Vibrio artabrorum]MDN3702188.1 carbohydrate porin [Vibrio artabrorum]
MKLTYLAGAALLTLASTSYANPVVFGNVDDGQLTLGGDAELNLNFNNESASSKYKLANDGSNFNQDGRLSFTVDGAKSVNNKTISFRFNPLYNTDGSVSLDDAWLNIDADSTALKAGRFEAADLFPKGQDVFVNQAGNASDSAIANENFYLYEMKEGRGRAAEAGQLMLIQKFGNLTAEVNTIFGKRTDIFTKVDTGTSVNDSLYVRPVLTYKNDGFNLSGGMEAQVLSDTAIVNGKDIGKRLGFGVSTGYATENIQFLANFAQMNAKNETDRSFGVNTTLYNFGIGYIRGTNDVKTVTVNGKESGALDTIYTSYAYNQALGFDNFDILVGAYYSIYSEDNKSGDAKNVGGRMRLKYYF